MRLLTCFSFDLSKLALGSLSQDRDSLNDVYNARVSILHDSGYRSVDRRYVYIKEAFRVHQNSLVERGPLIFHDATWRRSLSFQQPGSSGHHRNSAADRSKEISPVKGSRGTFYSRYSCACRTCGKKKKFPRPIVST